jgi:hypothetical protein
MKPVSLANISYEQGLKLLLLRKQALDQGSVQRMPPAALANTFVMNSTGTQVVKQAAGFLDTLKAMPGQAASLAKGTYNAGMDRVTTDPGLRSTLGYGLAGAGLGALGAGGLAASRKEKDWKRRLLQGATAGGLLGGGLGLALNPGSVTKGVEDKVTDLAEKSMQSGPKTEAELKSDRVKALQSTSEADPRLGAALHGGGTALAGAGAYGAAGRIPGMRPIDRRFIAEQLIDSYLADPKKVNAGRLESLIDVSKLKSPIPSSATSAQQLAADSLFGVKPTATTPIAPASPSEAIRQSVIAKLEHALPRKLDVTEPGLSAYFNDADQRKLVSQGAKNPGLFSRASSRSLMSSPFSRLGVAAPITAAGAIWSLLQYRKDLAAQQQATQQLRDLTPAATKP